MGKAPDIAITEYTRVPQSKWSKIVKELFKNKCLYCGATDGGTIVTRLESHHIYQKKVFPELSDVLENGVCLCHPCHNAAHHASYLPGYTGMGFTYGYKNYDYDDVDKVIKRYVETSFIIEMPKEEYNKLKAHAKRQGESINAFINRAIDEAMERDRREKE